MAKKDKFQQMKGGGALSSFQDMVQQAATVAAIEQQAASQNKTPTDEIPKAETITSETGKLQTGNTTQNQQQTPGEIVRFMRLPNPQIPVREYNLVSEYCNSFNNMTRQDFVELAIIEKLHRDGKMPDNEFQTRQKTIRNRPPRGQRKGTKSNK